MIGFPLANQLSQRLATAQPGILSDAQAEITEVSREEKDFKGLQLLAIVFCMPIDD